MFGEDAHVPIGVPAVQINKKARSVETPSFSPESIGAKHVFGWVVCVFVCVFECIALHKVRSPTEIDARRIGRLFSINNLTDLPCNCVNVHRFL